MKLVQPLITDDQAELVAAALRDAEDQLKELQSEDGGVEVTSEQVTQREGMAADIAALGRLSMLFQDASENPAKYPPAPEMAVVRSIVNAGKVPVPKSRRKKRSGRHQRRRALRMAVRRDREYIDMVNQAQASYEKDAKEHADALAEIEARIEGQPTFEILDGFGNRIMGGVPAEFIVDSEGNSPLLPEKLIVVGAE